MVLDGSLEQTQGEFKRKCRQAGCHIKQIEKNLPWSNISKAGIRELKRGTGRKLVKSKCPKVLWDDCLELEAQIWPNTAHNIYKLQGETPQTIISGETSDISPICELE